MWRGLRSLSILSATILLVLPLKASSAIPAAAAIAAVVSAFAGGVHQVWKGFSVVVVGARSAAFAQADEIWVSEPPNISRDELEEGTFETTAANWNIGYESSISIAPAAAPSGNAITVRAETKWEGFALNPEINMTEMRRASEDGVLWGKGFAHGIFKE